MSLVGQTIVGQAMAGLETAAVWASGGLFWVLLVGGILLAVILGFIAWAVVQSYGRSEPPAMPRLEEIAARGHEVRDSQPRVVLGFVVILVITVIFILISSIGLFRAFIGRNEAENRPATPELTVTDQLPPPPRLQSDPALDLNRFRQHEEEILNGYGWVDRAHGIVHIPIQRAMQLIAQQGLPAAQGQPETTSPPPSPAPRATNTSVRKP